MAGHRKVITTISKGTTSNTRWPPTMTRCRHTGSIQRGGTKATAALMAAGMVAMPPITPTWWPTSADASSYP